MLKVLMVLISVLYMNCLFSQNERINETFYEIPLSSVFETLNEKYGTKLSYDYSLIKKYKVTGNYTQIEVTSFLKEVLNETELEYCIVDGVYIIKPRKKNRLVPIQGLVEDKISGERLPYAVIQNELTEKVYVSDNEGYFVLFNPENQTQKYDVSYLGYNTREFVVNSATGDKLIIELDCNENILKKVDVKGKLPQIVETNGKPGHFGINPQLLSNLPAVGEFDLFRVLQLFPGISGSNNLASGLVIQSAKPDQTLVTFDGMTLFDQDHFFGMFSAINSNVVKNIQVYKGGFEAKYGNRTSSVVEIIGKTGDINKFRAQANFNLLNGNFVVEIPILKKASLLIGGRRSFGDFYKTKVHSDIIRHIKSVNDDKYWLINGNLVATNTSLEPDFSFYDINMKLSLPLLKDGHLSISLYQGQDVLSFDTQDSDSNLSRNSKEKRDWGTRGIGTKWTKKWSKKLGTSIVFNYSDYVSTHSSTSSYLAEYERFNNQDSIWFFEQVYSDTVNIDVSNTVKNLNFGWELTYHFNKKNTIELGMDNYFSKIEYSSFKYGFSEQDLFQRIEHFSPYFQNKTEITSRFNLIAGLRSNIIPQIGVFNLEPRVSSTFKITKNAVVKASFGKYHQYIQKITSRFYDGIPRDYWILADNSISNGISAKHFIVGGLYKSKSFMIDIEAYSKYYDDIVEYDNSAQNYYQNYANDTISYHQGQKIVHGFDFLISKSLGKYTGWLAYTLAKADNQFLNLNKGEKFPSINDISHEFKLVNMFKYGNWRFSLSWKYGTGKPDPAPDGDFYVFNKPSDNFVPAASINSKRLPSFHSLDFALYYNFLIGKTMGKVGISLLNIYGRRNIKSRFYIRKGYQYSSEVDSQIPAYSVFDINLPGFTPNITLSIKI